MATNPKAVLYKAIIGNTSINASLHKWVSNICYFSQLYLEKVCGSNTDLAHLKGIFNIGVHRPETCSGYIDLGNNPVHILNQIITQSQSQSNQRVKLTTIYRFSKNFSKILWHTLRYMKSLWINDADRAQIINTFRSVFGNVLDLNELEKHMRYVLYKHGLPCDVPTGKTIYDVFCDSFDDEFFNKVLSNSSYPSYGTSLTQPIGTDAVATIMGYKYDGGNTTRVRRTEGAKYVTLDTVSTYGEPLCELETTNGGLQAMVQAQKTLLPWVTGATLYTVNPNSEFAHLAAKNNKFVRCGPSCTTQMMLDCALLFGVDVYDAFLAIIPWMEVAKDHSLFEICIAANPYLPFHQYVVQTEGNTPGDAMELAFVNDIYTGIYNQTAGSRRKSSTTKSVKFESKSNSVMNKTRNKYSSRTMKGGTPTPLHKNEIIFVDDNDGMLGSSPAIKASSPAEAPLQIYQDQPLQSQGGPWTLQVTGNHLNGPNPSINAFNPIISDETKPKDAFWKDPLQIPQPLEPNITMLLTTLSKTHTNQLTSALRNLVASCKPSPSQSSQSLPWCTLVPASGGSRKTKSKKH